VVLNFLDDATWLHAAYTAKAAIPRNITAKRIAACARLIMRGVNLCLCITLPLFTFVVRCFLSYVCLRESLIAPYTASERTKVTII